MKQRTLWIVFVGLPVVCFAVYTFTTLYGSTPKPQEPNPPFAYGEEEVTFTNHEANITLSGTLTLPKSSTYPAVILISGYGAQNRDAEWNGHKPFLVLADHLTNLGVAVLRIDDRGVNKSTGDYYSSTSKDFARDVHSAVEFLRSRKDIEQIGLIGHSDGAMIAPMVAAESPHVNFIVLLGAPSIPGSELIVERQVLIERKLGKSEDEIDRSKQYMTNLVRTIIEAKDVKHALEEFAFKTKDDIPYDQIPKGTTREEFVSRQIWMLSSPWFKFYFNYDPRVTMKKVTCPVLALTGELDVQAPPALNLPAIKTALAEGKNSDATVKELKTLNHMFQESKTGMIEEYSSIDQTFSPIALNEISEWILLRISK
jgi:pimeloyl-ACP methyl ester carboxylesterase